MNALYLVRHGAYEGQSLTEKGTQEITETARLIQSELSGIDSIMIYHSPQTRARESAEIIAQTLAPIKTTLRQRMELDADCHTIHTLADTLPLPAIIVSHKPDIGSYCAHKGRIVDTIPTGSHVRLERAP